MLAVGSGRPPSMPEALEDRGGLDGPLAQGGPGPATTAPFPPLAW